MSKKIEFASKAIVIGKEFTNANKFTDKSGKEVSYENSWVLYLLAGTQHPSNGLYDTEPSVIKVQVPKEEYKTVKGTLSVNCMILQNKGNLSITKIDGMTIILPKKSEDVDGDEDEDIDE